MGHVLENKNLFKIRIYCICCAPESYIHKVHAASTAVDGNRKASSAAGCNDLFDFNRTYCSDMTPDWIFVAFFNLHRASV